MKIFLTLLKLSTLLIFASIVLLTIGTYLNLPLPLKPLVVKTGSMEPAIKTGSLVLVTDQGKSNININYVPGDIVTFKKGSELVSHRIVEVQKQGALRYFVTKGDANNSNDPTLVASSDIVGKVDFTLPQIGRFVDFVRTPLGFFLLILIPTLLIIISEIFAVWEELRKKRSNNGSNLDFAKPFAMLFMATIFLSGSHAFFSSVDTSTSNVLSTAVAFCDENPTVLSDVIEAETTQGTLKNGSPITNPARTDPTAVFVKNWVSGGSTGFYSVGFGGVATFAFPYPILNNDASLTFFEATNGRASYPLEKANVFVSENGVDFVLLGEITSEPLGDGVIELDLSVTGLSTIEYVRLVETSNPAIHPNDSDGIDVDAIFADFGACSDEQ